METENSIELSEKSIDILNEIRNSAFRVDDLAKELLKELRKDEVILKDDTYSTVKTNTPLMKILLLGMARGLCKTSEGSRYGLGYVSDFDLYFNMADKSFDSFLEGIHFDKNLPEYKTLKKNRFV